MTTYRTAAGIYIYHALSNPTIQTAKNAKTQTPHFIAGRTRNSPREGNALKIKASVDVIHPYRPISKTIDQMSRGILSFPPHNTRQNRAQFQLPDHKYRLTDDFLGHLGRAGMAVYENNRHLGDPEPLFHTAIIHLNLKRI